MRRFQATPGQSPVVPRSTAGRRPAQARATASAICPASTSSQAPAPGKTSARSAMSVVWGVEWAWLAVSRTCAPGIPVRRSTSARTVAM